MIFCFDIDDTISRHYNRDYANAVPFDDVIANMRRLRSSIPDCRIVLHTSRGMKSCGNNVAEAERKNRKTLEDWLKANQVPYDEIIFGKPFADVYVDDKNVHSSDFATYGVEVLSGFSGARVVRIGQLVIKEGAKAEEQRAWYEECRERFPELRVPDCYCSQFGKLFMEYIPGKTLNRCRITEPQLMELRNTLCKFASSSCGDNDLQGYIDYIGLCASGVGIEASSLLRSLQMPILRERTFCHGDFTPLNIINDGNELAYIDPSQKPYIGHWLLDAAKMSVSLRGLCQILDHESLDNNWLYNLWIKHFSQEEVSAIRLLERTHLLRVAYYAKKNGCTDKEKQLIQLYYGL